MKINNEKQSLIILNKEVKNKNFDIKTFRNSSFELLRIILMLLIILSHINYHGKSIPTLNSENYKQLINKKYILLRIISNYGKFGDILFIMISGFFSIKRKHFHYIKFLLISTETYTYHFFFYIFQII